MLLSAESATPTGLATLSEKPLTVAPVAALNAPTEPPWLLATNNSLPEAARPSGAERPVGEVKPLRAVPFEAL